MLVLLLLLGFSHLLLLGAVFAFLKEAASQYISAPKQFNSCSPQVRSASQSAVSEFLTKERAPIIVDQSLSSFPPTRSLGDCSRRKKSQKSDTTKVSTLIDNELLTKKPFKVLNAPRSESHVDTCKATETNGLHDNTSLNVDPKEKKYSFEGDNVECRARKKKLVVGKLLLEKVQELVVEDNKGIHWYCPVERIARFPRKPNLPLLLCLPGQYPQIFSTCSIIALHQILVVKFLDHLYRTFCARLSVITHVCGCYSVLFSNFY